MCGDYKRTWLTFGYMVPPSNQQLPYSPNTSPSNSPNTSTNTSTSTSTSTHHPYSYQPLFPFNPPELSLPGLSSPSPIFSHHPLPHYPPSPHNSPLHSLALCRRARRAPIPITPFPITPFNSPLPLHSLALCRRARRALGVQSS